MNYALNLEPEAYDDEYAGFAEETYDGVGEFDELPEHECEACGGVMTEYECEACGGQHAEYGEAEWESELERGRPTPLRPVRNLPGMRRPGMRPRVINRPRYSGHRSTACTCPAKHCPQHGSEYVRWVQSALNQINNLRLRVTGVMDAPTRSALRSFQQKQGLPADGIAGPEIREALLAAKKSKVLELQGLSNRTEDLEFSDEMLTSECPIFTPIAVENPGGDRIKNNSAPSANDIVAVSRAFRGNVPLHRLAAAALKALQCAARESGIELPLLQPTSGFRDPKNQAIKWQKALKKYGSAKAARQWVAPPGKSAHQSGRAIDFYLGGKNSSANVSNLKRKPAYQWLVRNASQFGFYPYKKEPWHWEYNPPMLGQPELFTENTMIKNSNFDFEGDIYETDTTYFQPELEQEWNESVALPLIYLSSASSTKPTINNMLAIMQNICFYHKIPWRIGYTILEHEGGLAKFNHRDGVMQTTLDARKKVIPQIPRKLKLALLGLPQNDKTGNNALNQSLHREFSRRLTVQIAAGVQELQDNLQKFNGYVALAFQAYNAGAGWGYYTVTRGKNKKRPDNIGADYWETLCRFGASLLHQLPNKVKINTSVWQCDKNIPAWFSHVSVRDQSGKLQLIAYKYLRRIRIKIKEHSPNMPCNQQSHKKRESGLGQIITKETRYGVLDKLYNPNKLSRVYYDAVKSQLVPIPEDHQPLKVLNSQLVKMPLVSGSDVRPIPV